MPIHNYIWNPQFGQNIWIQFLNHLHSLTDEPNEPNDIDIFEYENENNVAVIHHNGSLIGIRLIPPLIQALNVARGYGFIQGPVDSPHEDDQAYIEPDEPMVGRGRGRRHRQSHTKRHPAHQVRGGFISLKDVYKFIKPFFSGLKHRGAERPIYDQSHL